MQRRRHADEPEILAPEADPREVVNNILQVTRRHYSAEDEIRFVRDGCRAGRDQIDVIAKIFARMCNFQTE